MNSPDSGSSSATPTLNGIKCLDRLSELAIALRIPLTCLRVETPSLSKTIAFIGNRPKGASESTLPPDQTASSSSSQRVHPEVHGSTENFIVDDVYGKKKFAVASLAKLLIALVICILIHGNGEEKEAEDLDWEAKVYELLNKYRKKHGKDPVPSLIRDPNVEDVLLHLQGLPPMKDFLRSYDGKFMPSEEDFLNHGTNLANRMEHPISESYSTCNYILLQLLLKEIFNKSLSQIIEEKLLGPLKMTNTTMDPAKLHEWLRQKAVEQGYRVSSSLKNVVPVQELDDQMGDMEAAAFRCYSCTDDFSTLLRELFKARAGDQDCYIKPEVAALFFSRWNSGIAVTPAGFRGALDSDLPGSDSLNVYSRPKGASPSYKLGKAYFKKEHNKDQPNRGMKTWLKEKRKALRPLLRRTDRKQRDAETAETVEVFYKGGTYDGFTSSLYVSAYYQMFVIAFSNATGPLDFTDYACQAVLQDVFGLKEHVDIVDKVLKEDLPLAQSILSPIEQSDENIPELTEEILRFIGKYEQNDHHYVVEITQDGYFIRTGMTRSVMQARVVNGKLRVFPDSTPFCIDRRSAFVNPEFDIRDEKDMTVLIGDGGVQYQKLEQPKREE
ncbi:uncharacterized protein Z518_10505 [Rhinocladiella mackenziei CBS 650.93]|uniref:Rhinocladiella mackenziei CBS 650.93 unplaced genomic scaffold supercont1.9, whole genome shotgun sequence n=1 Tax=Rhinocladiella mackenziei CBS 650.93 TaxID=1442369 RepID=A0A0D2IAS2_9EURO|nr:uncharacterized protein Z518_10505 [Rhinocladiella mackenziei CBS 650.93]KIX00366.1 hypothetical protein Z518_10505 [Rhinocladiella mackenziei CBS 650.93]